MTISFSTLTVNDLNRVNYSGVLTTDSLLDNSINWNYLNPTRTVLYYTFDMRGFDDTQIKSGDSPIVKYVYILLINSSSI